MKLSRGKSNPKQPLASQQLEMETKKMEEKLAALKAQMEVEKQKKQEKMRTSGSRWATSTTTQPIKNYATALIQTKKDNDKEQKVDYAKMNKEFGQSQAMKQATMKNSSASSFNASSAQSMQRPQSNSSLKRSGKQSLNSTGKQQLNETAPNNILQRNGSANSIVRQQKIPPLKGDKQQQQQQRDPSQKLPEQFQALLAEMSLMQFEGEFLSRGFLTLDALSSKLDKETMTSMGIPPGFQIKLLKKISLLRETEKQKEEIIDNASSKENKIFNGSSTPRSKGMLETKNLKPKGVVSASSSEMSVENIKNNSNLSRVNENNSTQEEQSNLSVKESQQNKGEKQGLSKPPLKRKNSANIAKNKPADNSVNQKQPAQEDYEEEEKKNDQSTIQPIFFTTESCNNTVEVLNPSQYLGKKQSCWQCYTVVPEESMISYDDKQFCSEKCLHAFEISSLVKCSDCGRRINKTEARKQDAAWICLEKCLEQQPKTNDLHPQNQGKNNDLNTEKDQAAYEAKKILEYEELDRLRRELRNENRAEAAAKNNKKKILSLEEIEAKYKMQNNSQQS